MRAELNFGFITDKDSEFYDFVGRRFFPDFVIRSCKDKLGGLKRLAKKMSGIRLRYVIPLVQKRYGTS